ncbi:PPE family protein [Mycobacterium asiaticum]|uniref:PPE family domain-containing protein n=1 Tax=Mycobacterium asiaticum TaxID=1790 RepID=A0A1A3N350_MYCAS|nr:PPE family protein [Mycobacterium asiaticum]OBK16226.1 hypothetical protein A5635_00245 [Mycobacterium asiaticum]
MSFVLLPPEVNSARIYAGAGASPLIAAAAAWEGLAAELRSSASAFGGVITDLATGSWTGPASTLMSAAATPYVGWLNSAAGQAESAAGQARAAAALFDTALTATVHPAAVTANRVTLMSLVATNFLGQNTPAIAGTELDYQEMWAQDVAAMAGYQAGAVSVGSALAPLTVPPTILTDVASQAVSGLSSALQSVVSGLPVESLSSLVQVAALPVSMLLSPIMSLAQSANGAGLTSTAALGAEVPTLAGNLAAGAPPMGGGGLGAVAANLGRGRLVGALSAPPSWSGSTPDRVSPMALGALGGPSGAAASSGGMAGLGGMPMMPMPMGGMGAGAPGGMNGRGGGSQVMQHRPSVIPRTGIG